MSGDAPPPRIKFFLRGKGGVEAIWGPSSTQKDFKQRKPIRDEDFGKPHADSVEFSQDGSKVVLVDTQKGFSIHCTETSAVSLQVSHAGIQAIAWSPLGNYLLTWERYQKDSDADNLLIWDASNGDILGRFPQRQYARDNWPFVEWSSDELICCRQTANGVMIYSGNDFSKSLGHINLPNARSFSISPTNGPYRVAIFVPEKKGKPASVKIFEYPNGLDAAVATKSFYKAQEVTLKWSPNGTSLIIETRTDVDTSGKSYYGETGLFFLQADGQYDCIVPLMKEGQVHDVQWEPTGRGFVVLAGAMPSSATLYDQKANPIFDFGTASRNHISWSPHGRFLCLAGFGNLAGDMDFWDRNKLKKMGSANSNSATCHTWSPDSRYFLTATTFPRLRVDNGYKIFTYDGSGPIFQEQRKELYELKFRPAVAGVYPNRPQSPRRKVDDETCAPAPIPAKPQAYRPPRSTGALSAMMRSEETGPRKLDKFRFHTPIPTAKVPGMAPSVIPGMSPLTTSAPKKISRSARKKKAKDSAAAKVAIENALTQVCEEEPTCASPELSESEKQKKLKNLAKKLKQIEALKERQVAGEKLNEDQQAKLEGEADLRHQIKCLGI
uniref:Eukaryotic translation initiation factor 2A n=1 Tax=Albugo laibachii Nc14 TaxID=890382 RepID=F0W7N3_9STRA|nr:eukaryotic translation initiation factor 2A putative [Albugo laibachii Nc14]|eukprot:CCA17134.1 eukaryotic translation initiation factor 2A putative [Albugo laibachii Nc14]